MSLCNLVVSACFVPEILHAAILLFLDLYGHPCVYPPSLKPFAQPKCYLFDRLGSLFHFYIPSPAKLLSTPALLKCLVHIGICDSPSPAPDLA